MEEPTRVLATQIAAAFAQVGVACIPEIEKYIREAAVPRQVSYGCRVDFWLDKEENLRVRVVPAAPKLPTVELETTHMTLTWQDNQLAFDYEGEPKPKEPESEPTEPTRSEPTSLEPVAAAPNKSANGSDPVAKPPLPASVSVCPSVAATGDHDWVPDAQPGIYQCQAKGCGQRGQKPAPVVMDPA